MAGALKDIKVLDVTHVLAGPFCSYQLALLGADVLKIESPFEPDCARGRGPDDKANAAGLGLNYQVQASNKRAIALDLADARGRDILLQLVRTADVFVENYTTGGMARLGLGYETLSEINPALVHCSISGYGDTGPNAGKGAYDNVIQAVSGTVAQCGGIKPGVSFVDYSTGYSAAFAIAAALVQRGTTGKGCHISVSMLEVAMQMMAPEVAAAQHPADVSRRREAGISDYETADGRLMLGAFRPQQYRRLAALLEQLGVAVPELEDIRSWEDVWSVPDDVRNALADVFRTRKTDDWVRCLREADLPAEPVQSLSEAVQHSQLVARGYFQANPQDADSTLPLTAFRMSDGGPELSSAPPRHGQHSRDVLRELGLDEDRIRELASAGVVR
ncbi:CaiB/BaiF CoA transferase family protein [Roseibium sp. SCP14]|uniref:CaiB/BaiF CoA transferase family protein n=1 Tax=Roseibium sp. SCP14 TaxID=3141375 RepID=UPI00333B71FE